MMDPPFKSTTSNPGRAVERQILDEQTILPSSTTTTTVFDSELSSSTRETRDSPLLTKTSLTLVKMTFLVICEKTRMRCES